MKDKHNEMKFKLTVLNVSKLYEALKLNTISTIFMILKDDKTKKWLQRKKIKVKNLINMTEGKLLNSPL